MFQALAAHGISSKARITNIRSDKNSSENGTKSVSGKALLEFVWFATKAQQTI